MSVAVLGDTQTIDAIAECHGSIWLIRPMTVACREWLECNVQADAMWFCAALVVEPRYVDQLVAAMTEVGFAVTQPSHEEDL